MACDGLYGAWYGAPSPGMSQTCIVLITLVASSLLLDPYIQTLVAASNVSRGIKLLVDLNRMRWSAVGSAVLAV